MQIRPEMTRSKENEFDAIIAGVYVLTGDQVKRDETARMPKDVTFNHGVAGSSPAALTIFPHIWEDFHDGRL